MAQASRLWRSARFLQWQAGMTASTLGFFSGAIALPTLAIDMFNASSFQVGLLVASEMIAFPFLGLIAGLVADK